MSTSVPAAPDPARGLAGVLPAALSSVLGESNGFGLRRAASAAVVLVDGLGALQLRANEGHARRLASLGRARIRTVFPTTTVAAIASLTTGAPPGRHGLAGYRLVDPETDRVVEHLSRWTGAPDPDRWQPLPTVFETATARSIEPIAVGPERYRSSRFTAAVLRGARYVGENDLAARIRVAAELLREPGRLLYVYVPELDTAGHRAGVDSGEWRQALETVDAALAPLVAPAQPGAAGVLVTGDHGMVDVPPSGHRFFDDDPALLAGVRHVAGEPRGLQLHFEPGLDKPARLDAAARWTEWVGRDADVLQRDQLADDGWFGGVDPSMLPRFGDVFVVARRAVAYYDGRTAGDALGMVGQHGARTDDESLVPLLRAGAFAA